MASALKRHKHAKHDVFDDIERIKASLTDTSLGFKDLLGDAYTQSIDSVKDRSTEARDNVETYITENPFKAIGISMLSGLIVGYILKRK